MASENRNFIVRIFDWLETHWATPAYGGWVLIGIGLSFFGAATNTMAGWLYVLSGILSALLGLNFINAIGNIKHLKISRSSIKPAHAEDEIIIETVISNPTKKSKILIELLEKLPARLGKVDRFTIEDIASNPPQRIHQQKSPYSRNQETHFPIEIIPRYGEIKITAFVKTNNRGIYFWDQFKFKSAAPFGLFSCIRPQKITSKATIYPQILPLNTCPLIDEIGKEEVKRKRTSRRYQNATEGITKSIRNYRYGDPIRLIHWRSSARFGELQVRELETVTGGEDILLCLDNSCQWDSHLFEEAVKSIASIYFYASRKQLPINVWIGNLGVVHGRQVILETLAGVDYDRPMTAKIPDNPIIWVTQNSQSVSALPEGSRYLLFSPYSSISGKYSGLVYDGYTDLATQLQKPIDR